MSGDGTIAADADITDKMIDCKQAEIILNWAKTRGINPELPDSVYAHEVHAESSRVTPIGDREGVIYGIDTHCQEARPEIKSVNQCYRC